MGVSAEALCTTDGPRHGSPTWLWDYKPYHNNITSYFAMKTWHHTYHTTYSMSCIQRFQKFSLSAVHQNWSKEMHLSYLSYPHPTKQGHKHSLKRRYICVFKISDNHWICNLNFGHLRGHWTGFLNNLIICESQRWDWCPKNEQLKIYVRGKDRAMMDIHKLWCPLHLTPSPPPTPPPQVGNSGPFWWLLS